MQTLVKCRLMRHFIRVYTVCQIICLPVSRMKETMSSTLRLEVISVLFHGGLHCLSNYFESQRILFCSSFGSTLFDTEKLFLIMTTVVFYLVSIAAIKSYFVACKQQRHNRPVHSCSLTSAFVINSVERTAKLAISKRSIF